MPVQFYIAFYSTGTPGNYHWSLVPSAEGLPSLRRRTRLYEISKERHAVPTTTTTTTTTGLGRDRASASSPAVSVCERWVCSPGERALGASRRFLGVLAFPPCRDAAATLADVHAFLDDAPPVPAGLSAAERQAWTCAQWVVHVLLCVAPALGLDFARALRPRDVLLAVICAHALKLEEGGWEEAVGREGAAVRCVRFPEHYLAPPSPPPERADADA